VWQLPETSPPHANERANLCLGNDGHHYVGCFDAFDSRCPDIGTLDLWQRGLPISRLLSADTGCRLPATNGRHRSEQILVRHKTPLVSTSLRVKKVDRICGGHIFPGMSANSVPVLLRARRLPVSPGKILLRLRDGGEFHLCAVHGIGLHRVSFCHHDVPVRSNLLLGAKRGVPTSE